MLRSAKKPIYIICSFVLSITFIAFFTNTKNDNRNVSIVTVDTDHKLSNDNFIRKVKQTSNVNFIKETIKTPNNNNDNVKWNRKHRQDSAYVDLERTIRDNLQHFPKVFTYRNGWWLNTAVCDKYFKTITPEDIRKYYRFSLKTPEGVIPIYTHDPKKDLISNAVRVFSEGSVHIDNAILNIMKPYSDSILIDVGSNLGIQTLHVLKAGKSTVSVEASEANVQRLCLTSAVNKLSQNLTIIFNAAGAEHGNIQFAIGSKGNQGSNFVVESSILKLKTSRERWIFPKVEPINVPVMRLDDILDLPLKLNKNSNICVKIDVEGYEDAVFKGAENLFNQTHVHGVVMEWMWHKSRESGKRIIDLMKQYKLSPHALRGKALNPDIYPKWPLDVVWVPTV